MRPLLLRATLFLVVALIGIFIASRMIEKDRELPVYNPDQINKELVDSSLHDQYKGHRIQSFAFVNQFGETISERDFQGCIYVADFFFTTCQGICPDMSGQMSRLQQHFADEPRVKFISHSVLPEMDSVPVLAEYAERYGAIAGKWHLVTGSRKSIYHVARKSYFTLKPAAVGEGDGGDSDFIHTQNFVLVDPDKKIRGYYDGTSTRSVDRLMDDIELLIAQLKD